MITAPSIGSRRGQSGMSLIEVLLVMLLTGMLLGPLTAWWILATRQQPVIADDSVRVASTALLSRYVVRDIAVAGGAANAPELTATVNFTFQDCRGGEGEGGRVVLVLVRGGLERLTKTVYTEVASGGTATIWRRSCDSDTGLNTTATAVSDQVETGSSANCTAGGDGSICRLVELRVTPVDADPVVYRGVRRVDTATVSAGLDGARSPIAKITVASQSSSRPYQVEFSAETSTDPDGTILCYQWVFTTAAEGRGDPDPAYVTVEVPDPDRDPSLGSPCPDRAAPVTETSGDPGPTGDRRRQLRSLPTSGVYFVELIVTDDDGLSSTTYLRFEIEPRDPIAQARVAPVVGGTSTAGATVFEFAAQWLEDGVVQGTRHPDGDIVEYRWSLVGNGLAFQAVRTTPSPWYLALPIEMVGNLAVSLTVLDGEGRSAEYVTGVILTAPPPDATVPSGTVWPPGAHAPPANVRLGGPVDTVDGAQVLWDAATQADRYIIETDVGCVPTSLSVVAPAGPLSAPLLPPWCEATSQVRVRVAAEFGATLSAWSPWVDATVPVQRIDPATLEDGG